MFVGPTSSLAAALPRAIHLGPVRLPVFGFIATAGLLLAMALSRRTARRAGLDPERVWDAGLVAVVSAFGLSRLLLVATHWRLFCTRPLLVLGSPSLSTMDVAAAAGVLVWWLRRKGLPALRVANAWAAPALLLLAAMALGHFAEGTDAGMPTSLPWGVPDFALGRVHPVQIYAAAGYGLLCVWLLRAAPDTGRPGRLAGKALAAGGVLSFFLSFLRQPYELLGNAWLDPGQYVALAAVAGGCLLSVAPLQLYAERRSGAPLTHSMESR